MNNKELTELKKEEEMKPNDLNYLKLVRDMNDMLENDFCMDMNCKLHLHGGRDKNSFTQEEAQQMADLIGKLYTLSHYWYCHCGLGKGYELTKTAQSNDEIKREAVENFKDWVINRQTEDGYKYKMWYEYIEEYLTQKETQ